MGYLAALAILIIVLFNIEDEKTMEMVLGICGIIITITFFSLALTS